MGPFVVVYVTVGSVEEGEKLAAALVEERLAACVNRVGPIRSTYRWEGKLERSEEELLVIKTRKDLFDALKRRVQELHSYSVPEIIALPIVDGNESYLRWLEAETGGESKK
jgi:periplasmic divalent cation tolerance protein